MRSSRLTYLLMAFIVIVSTGGVLLYEKAIFNNSYSGLLISVMIFLAFAVICIIRNFSRKESDPYEIINPILVLYSLYTLMLPVNYLIRPDIHTLHVGIAGEAMPPVFQYTVICMIGLFGLTVGYYLPFGKQCARKVPVWEISNRQLQMAAVLLLIYGLLSFATNIAAYGGIHNFIKVGYSPERYVIQRHALAFGQGLELIGMSTIMLMFVAFKEKRRWLLMILASIVIGYVIISLLIGQRRYIIYLLIIAFILSNYGISRIKLRWFLIAMLVAYCFFFVYAHSRGLWAELGLREGLVMTYNIATRNPLLILPFAGGEFIPPAKVILEVLCDSSFQFQYGSSYIVGLIRILPRVGKFWPQALQTLAEWRMMTYYPGFFERGVSFNFITAAEGYVNFGIIGVFLHMAFYGFVAKAAYSYFRQHRSNTFVLLTYSIIFCMMLFEGIHGESGQALWTITHTYLGPVLLVILVVKFIDRVSKNARLPQQSPRSL